MTTETTTQARTMTSVMPLVVVLEMRPCLFLLLLMLGLSVAPVFLLLSFSFARFFFTRKASGPDQFQWREDVETPSFA